MLHVTVVERGRAGLEMGTRQDGSRDNGVNARRHGRWRQCAGSRGRGSEVWSGLQSCSERDEREFGGHDTKQCNSRMKAGASPRSPAPRASQAPRRHTKSVISAGKGPHSHCMVAMWSRANVEVLVGLREADDMQGVWYDHTQGEARTYRNSKIQVHC